MLILQRVFDGYFMLLKKEISGYTTNINEYIYVFSFLYEHYIEPLKEINTVEELENRLKKPLVDKAFKQKLAIVQGSGLFMHLTNLDEVQTEMKAEDEKQFYEKVSLSQMASA